MHQGISNESATFSGQFKYDTREKNYAGSNMVDIVLDEQTKTNNSTEDPVLVLEILRPASQPFTSEDMIKVEGVVRSASLNLQEDELLACCNSSAVYESHKLEDNLSLNIKHLCDCEDLFIGLKQKKVRCFQSSMKFRVRTKLWPSPGTGCLDSSPSLLEPTEKGQENRYETPRFAVESRFDDEIDMDVDADIEFAQQLVIPAFSMIDLKCKIKDLPLTSYVTFEICANNEHIAMAWTGVQLFDYEKRLIRGRINLPLTMGPLPPMAFPTLLNSATAENVSHHGERAILVEFNPAFVGVGEDKSKDIVYTEPWEACLNHGNHELLRAKSTSKKYQTPRKLANIFCPPLII